MKLKWKLLIAGICFIAIQMANAQGGNLTLPNTVVAGTQFPIQSKASENSILYIIGPGQALMRKVQQGQAILIPAGSLYNAGHYLAVLVGKSSTTSGSFDIAPTSKPTSLIFLAKPSRLPVGIKNGISGSLYVFDVYRNLIVAPEIVYFKLTNKSGPLQERTSSTHNGAAWTELDSSGKEGIDQFEAQVEGISSTRIVEQVPGDPCNLKMHAKQAGQQLVLETDPVLDCSGNSIPDGTIVTFTESYHGTLSTIDMPIKRGIAQVEMAARNGAKISVASGVVLGNEIDWK